MDEKILICECNDVEHQVVIRYNKEDNEAYVSVHLVKKNLYERLKNAFNYLLGHKSIYGDFDEFIFGSKYASFFKELGEKLEKNDKDYKG